MNKTTIIAHKKNVSIQHTKREITSIYFNNFSYLKIVQHKTSNKLTNCYFNETEQY